MRSLWPEWPRIRKRIAGQRGSSRADYYLRGREQVARFLRETRAALEGRG